MWSGERDLTRDPHLGVGPDPLMVTTNNYFFSTGIVLGMWQTYLVAFVSSAFFCVVLTPVAMRVAVRSGILARPSDHECHKPPVPNLGGIAIVVAFVIAVVASLVVMATSGWPPHAIGIDVVSIVLAVAVGLAFVGLVDDVRQLPPSWHIGAEIAAAVVVWSAGNVIVTTNLEAVNLCLTVIWFVGITNAFKFLNNTDGVAAGLTTITCLTLFAIASRDGQLIVATLSIGLAGSTIGFLVYNRPPARVLMGDCGARFVGFLVAYFVIILEARTGTNSPWVLVPVCICSYAILDTSLVVISRLTTSHRPWRGGQHNISQRLLDLGLPLRTAVTMIYLAAMSIGVLSFVIYVTNPQLASILVVLMSLALVAGGTLLLRAPLTSDGSNQDGTNPGRGKS